MDPGPMQPDPSSAVTGIIIGLVSSFGSLILISLVVFIFWASGCAGSGRILLDRFGRPGEYDDEQAFLREEEEALERMDEIARADYLRAKAFVTANPPESMPTDISLSQYLAIQEKGISAWEFEPELEIANCFVENRTEIEFYDSECTVMCNLPVPKQNDVYYWEAKIYEKPENTLLGIGMATKPYPLFRLPGYHKYSVAYHSDGTRHYNQPFSKTAYGPNLVQGDVIGVGYRPRTGAIFFTRNGKRLEEVVHGLKAQNWFPAIGSTGPATIHVNLGQAGFVFIEANVKKWGLAPVTGSLAPPPPYGSEQGSILLEAAYKDGYAPAPGQGHGRSYSGVTYSVPATNTAQHGRTRSGNFRMLPPTSPGPARSPTDISLAQLVPTDEAGETSTSNNQTNVDNPLRLHLEDATNPPPDYTSPTQSQSDRSLQEDTATDDEEEPLIHVINRSRNNSAVASTTAAAETAAEFATAPLSPVPSYRDAMQQGGEFARRDSVSSEASQESASSNSTEPEEQ